ncbi:hypothetical protein H5410_007372 [Solanum commersonii]|uniref:Uncharacterized protein n=1 Tax=Solanum commersonii TaxID=4109 RepID=A0A9J6ADC0_SOLCO|nr:hypothetical protein H5410_007372 [Solanum commersonii]
MPNGFSEYCKLCVIGYFLEKQPHLSKKFLCPAFYWKRQYNSTFYTCLKLLTFLSPGQKFTP